MAVLGLDIGGANLKAADTIGKARQRPFALWKHPERLADELRLLVADFPDQPWAVTMTGELCDCFETKADGVRHILRCVQEVRGDDFLVWTTNRKGSFRGPAEAMESPTETAAANWLALGRFAGRLLPTGLGIVLDIGSTTTDVTRLLDGVPIARNRTDQSRLNDRELIYCGVRRTPLCAFSTNPAFSRAAEWFATTEDIYVLRGELPEEPDRSDTADGRPATKEWARRRVLRMWCADDGDVSDMTRLFRQQQVACIASALRYQEWHRDPLTGIVIAGAGEFLGPSILEEANLQQVKCVSLAERLGPDLSVAACAYAVAVLAEERA
jgi:probable H4MPT-linked C1 transfer pathway protein